MKANEILQLNHNYTAPDINKHFKALVLGFHPDKVPSNDPDKARKTEIFRKICDVTQKLRDRHKLDELDDEIFLSVASFVKTYCMRPIETMMLNKDSAIPLTKEDKESVARALKSISRMAYTDYYPEFRSDQNTQCIIESTQKIIKVIVWDKFKGTDDFVGESKNNVMNLCCNALNKCIIDYYYNHRNSQFFDAQLEHHMRNIVNANKQYLKSDNPSLLKIILMEIANFIFNLITLGMYRILTWHNLFASKQEKSFINCSKNIIQELDENYKLQSPS
jgi:curved DNA-binding protein CbpA